MSLLSGSRTSSNSGSGTGSDSPVPPKGGGTGGTSNPRRASASRNRNQQTGALLSILLLSCAPEPLPARTLGEVCGELGAAACTRAAECLPAQASAFPACIGTYAETCCGAVCGLGASYPPVAVEDCVRGYQGLACDLVAVQVPAECGGLRK